MFIIPSNVHTQTTKKFQFFTHASITIFIMAAGLTMKETTMGRPFRATTEFYATMIIINGDFMTII